MPELPEVETLCRQMNALLPGGEILRIDVLDSRLGKIEGLVGRRIESVTRRGKYIQIRMSGGMTAEIHLRMSGRLLWKKGGTAPGFFGEGGEEIGSCPPFLHTRMAIHFASGTLFLLDPRRFATFTLQPDRIAPTRSKDPQRNQAGTSRGRVAPALSEDPLEGLPGRKLREIARGRRLPVKSFLLDQRLIAGIGNIYACEILFATGIDPRRSAGSLTPAEWRGIAKEAAAILCRAVSCRGTTVSDWRDLFGCSGTNQDHLEVYSRQGQPCRRCGAGIERIVQSGRGTWLCPVCQK